MNEKNVNQKLYTMISVGLLIVFILLIVGIGIYAVNSGAFNSEEDLKLFISDCGMLAPVVYCLLNIFSVVVLIIPSTWWYAVGPILFTPFWGILLNCLSSFIGSVVIFLMVKKWGKPLLKMLVPEKSLNKYYGLLENEKRFEKVFAFMQIFPFTPDNTFAYIAGCSKMTFKRLCTLVISFKLWKIVIMGIGTDLILEFVMPLIEV